MLPFQCSVLPRKQTASILNGNDQIIFFLFVSFCLGVTKSHSQPCNVFLSAAFMSFCFCHLPLLRSTPFTALLSCCVLLFFVLALKKFVLLYPVLLAVPVLACFLVMDYACVMLPACVLMTAVYFANNFWSGPYKANGLHTCVLPTPPATTGATYLIYTSD